MSLGVLLVDDEPLIRSGLRAIINAEADLRWSARPRTEPPSHRSCDACARMSC